MSKANDLLAQVDDAFEAVDAASVTAADVRKLASDEIAAAQATLDAVKLDHGQRVAAADATLAAARATLEKIQGQLNERIGFAVNPRVSVR